MFCQSLYSNVYRIFFVQLQFGGSEYNEFNDEQFKAAERRK